MSHKNGIFPELTIELPSTQSGGTAVAAPLAITVQNALREVLAWRPKASDPKGFVAAIDQAFTLHEVEGRTKWQWTPRSYSVQADMGAVTGAQASIYARARAALDQSIPLVEGLYPLRADADDEDVEAIRALVEFQLTELVNELGVVGGPRLPRVEGLFDALLGVAFNGNDPEKVEGLLGAMRTQFGMERIRVNTIDEEQNLTNFLIVVDHTLALKRSWNTLKHFFDRKGSDVFLGTQLVLLSRLLAVVAESVQELYFLLDSVRLGAAERLTVMLNSGLTIAELLSWVERFALEEGPAIIRDAGKDGVIALQATLVKLLDLVEKAWQQAQGRTNNPQAGFHSERVQAGFEELTLHLRDTLKFAAQIRRQPRPELKMIEPDTAVQGEEINTFLYGENFLGGAQVRLSLRNTDVSIEGQNVLVVNSTMIRADFYIPQDIREEFGLPDEADISQWSVVVINPDGGLDWLKGSLDEAAFTIIEEDLIPVLAVKSVEFHFYRDEPFTVDDLSTVIEINRQGVYRFAITFTEELDLDTLLPGVIQVTLVGTSEVVVAGEIVVHPPQNDTVIFQLVPPNTFQPGLYVVTVVGGENGIQSASGHLLASNQGFRFRILVNEESVAVPLAQHPKSKAKS